MAITMRQTGELPGMWEQADLVGGETDREPTALTAPITMTLDRVVVFEDVKPVAVVSAWPGVGSLLVYEETLEWARTTFLDPEWDPKTDSRELAALKLGVDQ